MTRGPALGVLEVSTIARGVVTADAGLKRAPAVLLHSRAVSGGKHLVFFEGGVAEVEEAMGAGKLIAAAVRVEHGFHHTATMQSTNIDNMSAMARVCNCSIFVKNDASYAGLGLGGEGYTSFTIASPTGEGLTTAVHFTRERRCTLKEAFRFV